MLNLANRTLLYAFRVRIVIKRLIILDFFKKCYVRAYTIVNLRNGFTIIEFLIVISILGIAGTLVTTSYLSFEKRHRVKSAALEVKSQIRLAQSNALSGFKGKAEGSGNCESNNGNTLIGWYALVDQVANELTLAGVCDDGTNEYIFAESSIKLEDSLDLITLHYEGFTSGERSSIIILFRPLENDAVFFNYTPSSDQDKPPVVNNNFLNDSGGLNSAAIIDNELNLQEKVVIGVDLVDRGNQYNINILPSGEINELQL